MQVVPLQAVPNQSFSIQLDGNNWDFVIHDCGNGLMAVDIALNGTQLISGFRMVPGWPLIPYQYLQDGNFVILTNNDEYPDWRQFGITQTLIYASQTEIQAIAESA